MLLYCQRVTGKQNRIHKGLLQERRQDHDGEILLFRQNDHVHGVAANVLLPGIQYGWRGSFCV